MVLLIFGHEHVLLSFSFLFFLFLHDCVMGGEEQGLSLFSYIKKKLGGEGRGWRD